MKKLLALLLTLVMCLSLAACGGSGTDTSGTDTSSGETGEDSGDSSYRVAMICDSSISDGGWGMSCYNAMVDAAAERGWATEVSDSIAQSAYYDTIISYCDLGYDLIYAPGNQYTDAVLQAAEEFPAACFKPFIFRNLSISAKASASVIFPSRACIISQVTLLILLTDCVLGRFGFW